MIMNRCIAEAMGTFMLVFAGCGAIVVDQLYGGAMGHLGVSLVFGLVVMAVIYAIGNISGAHINPAVTIGFWFAGRLPLADILPYIASQLLGAVAAAAVLALLFGVGTGLGATSPSVPLLQAFVMEFILSFMLMFVILNVSTGHKETGMMAGVAVGGTVAFEAMMGGPVTGASMNPARSLGPALVSGQLQYAWLYILAPTIGMIAAFPTCRWIQGGECCGPTP